MIINTAFLCGSYLPEAIEHELRKDREHKGGKSLILKVRRHAEWRHLNLNGEERLRNSLLNFSELCLKSKRRGRLCAGMEGRQISVI